MFKMDRDIFIIGDLHLVDLEARKKGSRSYKDPRFSIDRPFAAFLRWISASKRPATLVLNGDFIDFDLIYLGPGVDVATAKRKFDRILKDHHDLFEGIVHLLAQEKNRLILILGNHDLEFTQGEFLDYFFLRLSQLYTGSESEGVDQEELRTRISIEPWFYYEKGLFYAEHGDRFDRYGTSPRPSRISINPGTEPPFLSLGSLSNRYILKDIPTFNPLMIEQVIHGLGGYIGHILRHDPFTPYRLPFRYLRGAIKAFLAAIRQRKRYLVNPYFSDREEIVRMGRERDLQAEEVLSLWRLGKESVILTSLLRTFHILWLDRVCIFFLFGMAFLLVLLFYRSFWLLLILIPFMALVYSLYELAWGKKEVLHERRGFREHAEHIGKILHAPYVILSHIHRPDDVVLDGRSRYLNCGSWATIFDDRESSRLWQMGRTCVHISLREGRDEARLMRWSEEGPMRVELK